MALDKKINLGLLTASISRNAGGLYNSVRYLASGLIAQHEVNVHIFGLKDHNTAADLPAWGRLPMHICDIKGPSSVGYAPALKDTLKKSNLDILHTQGLWLYPSVEALKWSKQTGKPYLISPRGMLDPWAVRNSYWKKKLAGMLFENSHLRGAACLHALCESEHKAIRSYGLRNPICIIPNGAPPPHVNTVEPAPFWKQTIPCGAKILLYLGRLHPKKGLLQLLEAWAKTRREADTEVWHLAIAGWDQGGHEQTLKKLAESLNINDRVHFIGSQFGEQKHATYQQADAFILPSFSEGLPMTVLEAWSYSIPVLMTPQCNLPEGFQMHAALYIEPDVQLIETGLISLFEMTDEELSFIGKQGKLLTEQQFSWPHIAKQMSAVYQWVTGQSSKPDCVVLE